MQQGIEPLLHRSFGQRTALVVVLQLQHGPDVVFDIELAKNGGFLRQIAQAQAGTAVDGLVFDGLSVQQNLPAIGPHQAHDHVERSGFARAVGAQQADHLAFGHRQRHVFDDLAAAIRFFEVKGFKPDHRRIGLRG